MSLPLHIFEARYRSMVGEALARDRHIAMIQPNNANGSDSLFETGCLGKIGEIEAFDDGRYNLMLQGVARFTMIRELEVATPFRQAEVELWDEERGADEALSSTERALLEQEARKFAAILGYEVEWSEVERLDDYRFVCGIAQVAPFDPASKQALLEAPSLKKRMALLVNMMEFYSRHDGDDGATTLQ